MNQHPKSNGALFVNKDRTTQKQPNFKGHIVVTKEQIQRLIDMAKAGLEPRLQLAAWQRTSASNVRYMSVESEAYMPQQQGTQPPPQRAPAPPPQDDGWGSDSGADPWGEPDFPDQTPSGSDDVPW